MSWLYELARNLSGQALLTAVESKLYERAADQPKRPARWDVHWTNRARAIISQAGLSHRIRVEY